MRILLIEDNDSIAEIVRRSLTTSATPNRDYFLDYAGCGSEGLRLARNKAYDGYLVDLNLPDIHGLQIGLALRHLMQRSRLQPGWIVAVTAQSDAITKQRARELGFNAFLAKPFSPSDLPHTFKSTGRNVWQKYAKGDSMNQLAPLNLFFIVTRLIGCVISMSCVILVVFQLKHDRKSWLFTALAASTVGLLFTGLLFRVLATISAEKYYDIEVTIFALVSFFTVMLVVCGYLFCMEYLHAWTPLRLFWGRVLVVLTVPSLLLSSKIIVPNSLVIYPDGRIDFEFSVFAYSLFFTGIITSFFNFRALYEEYRDKKNHAPFLGWFTAGIILMMSAAFLTWIPVLKQYSLEHLCYTLAFVLLTRPILQQNLFNPLADLNRQIEGRAQALAMVTQVNQRIAASLHFDTLLSAAVDEICHHFNFAQVCLYLRDGEYLKLHATADTAVTESPSTDKRLQIGNATALSQAVVKQVITVEHNPYHDQLPNAIRSEANLPLIDQSTADGYVIGVLTLRSTVPNIFSDDELSILQLLPQQLVTAIHNAELFNEAEKARQVANQANEAKTQFLSVMSHDLRTPLQTILVVSQFMEKPESYADTRLSSDYRQDVAKVVQTSHYMKQLVNGILDFAKIEAGELELRQTALDPLPILIEVREQAVRLLQPTVSLVDCFQPSLPMVYADDLRLREILLNLVSNACKFCESGQITLGVQQNEPGLLCFSVADTGPGIETDLQPVLFNRFKQAHSNLRKHGGTGLGLSISKRLVELQHGQIWFESIPNKGTTFYFTIPLASQAQVSLPACDPLPQFYNFGQSISALPAQIMLVAPEHFAASPMLTATNFEVLSVSAQHAVELAVLVEPTLIVILEAEHYPQLATQLRGLLPPECMVFEHPTHKPIDMLKNELAKMSTVRSEA